MRLFFDHWSCSALARRLWVVVGHPKPRAATLREWGAWRRVARTEHPKVYWLTETALDAVRKALIMPFERLNGLRHWWLNRLVRKTHCLRTGLAPGRWHEPSETLLHASFALLVDFVEIDLAFKQRWSHARLPWWQRIRWLRWGVSRSPAEGLSYLEWECTLDDLALPEYEAAPEQAAAAREILTLYLWWTESRPARPDPYRAAGYRAEDDDISFDDLLLREPTESDHARLRRLADIKAQYDAEDDIMLARLVAVRRALWS